MTTTMINKKIEQFVKRTVNEAINSQFIKLRALVLPYISTKEQLDIETRYGKKPSRKSVKSFSFEL